MIVQEIKESEKAEGPLKPDTALNQVKAKMMKGEKEGWAEAS